MIVWRRKLITRKAIIIVACLRPKEVGQTYARMIFSRGSGGSPTASCFCRTMMSVAAFDKPSATFPSNPAVCRTSHHCLRWPANKILPHIRFRLKSKPISDSNLLCRRARQVDRAPCNYFVRQYSYPSQVLCKHKSTLKLRTLGQKPVEDRTF